VAHFRDEAATIEDAAQHLRLPPFEDGRRAEVVAGTVNLDRRAVALRMVAYAPIKGNAKGLLLVELILAPKTDLGAREPEISGSIGTSLQRTKECVWIAAGFAEARTTRAFPPSVGKVGGIKESEQRLGSHHRRRPAGGKRHASRPVGRIDFGEDD
jgi:hypothetical protein